jgi:hypothetical protein
MFGLTFHFSFFVTPYRHSALSSLEGALFPTLSKLLKLFHDEYAVGLSEIGQNERVSSRVSSALHSSLAVLHAPKKSPESRCLASLAC